MNETAHDEANSSEAEDDTSEGNSVYEIESHLVNREQNEQEDKLLSTNFAVKVESRKVEGLITYSTDQQRFKFMVNSGTDQEKYGEFMLIFNQFIVNGPLMPFYSMWVSM